MIDPIVASEIGDMVGAAAKPVPAHRTAAAPIVPDWYADPTVACAHYVDAGVPVRAYLDGRPTAHGLCCRSAYRDPEGRARGRRVDRCPECVQLLAAALSGLSPPVPCPRSCQCGWCGQPLRRGEDVLPGGLDCDRRQLWDHPLCWNQQFAGL